MRNPLAVASARWIEAAVPRVVPPSGAPEPIRLTVYGEPAPKGSRTTGRRRDGSTFTRPASKREHPWVEAVAKSAMWRRSQGGALPTAPYAVRLDFYCPRPQRPSHAWPTVGDVDKLARAVLDGLVVGGLLSDDRHVLELVAVKRWAAAPGGEGVQVTIAQAGDEEAAASMVAATGSQLRPPGDPPTGRAAAC